MRPQISFNALPIAARLTIVSFGAAGLAAILMSFWLQPQFPFERIGVLMAIAGLSARAKVNLYRGSTISFLTCVVMLAVIREGPAIAVLLGVCGVTVQTLFPSRKIVVHQLAFNSGMIALTITATWWIHHTLTALAFDIISSDLTATILASFTYFLGNSISVSLIVSLSQKISIIHIWSQHFLYSAPSFLIAGLLSLGIIALISAHFLLIAAVLVVVISLAYYCSIRRMRYSEA